MSIAECHCSNRQIIDREGHYGCSSKQRCLRNPPRERDLSGGGVSPKISTHHEVRAIHLPSAKYFFQLRALRSFRDEHFHSSAYRLRSAFSHLILFDAGTRGLDKLTSQNRLVNTIAVSTEAVVKAVRMHSDGGGYQAFFERVAESRITH